MAHLQGNQAFFVQIKAPFINVVFQSYLSREDRVFDYTVWLIGILDPDDGLCKNSKVNRNFTNLENN